MGTAIARFTPGLSASLVANVDSFVTVATFGGLGLLLSLVVMILDQQIPGEWF
jgi:hypothetical protein